MKKYKPEIHPEARIDFFAQIEYLATQGCSIEILRRLTLEMREASEAIAQNPLTWPSARPSQQVRK
jgi:hypothetical protein